MCGMKILQLMAETKITIHKLDGNLLYIITTLRTKLSFPKIKILSTFHPNDFGGKLRYYCCKLFMPYSVYV